MVHMWRLPSLQEANVSSGEPDQVIAFGTREMEDCKKSKHLWAKLVSRAWKDIDKNCLICHSELTGYHSIDYHTLHTTSEHCLNFYPAPGTLPSEPELESCGCSGIPAVVLQDPFQRGTFMTVKYWVHPDIVFPMQKPRLGTKEFLLEPKFWGHDSWYKILSSTPKKLCKIFHV